MSSNNAQSHPTAKPQEDVVNAPRSLRETQSLSSDTHEEESDADFAVGKRGVKTQLKKSREQARQQLQSQIDESAKKFRRIWKQDTTDDATKKATELVLIRAMKTQHPGPVIGSFSFQDIYTHFIDGMKYTVPRYVGERLEEVENAIIM